MVGLSLWNFLELSCNWRIDYNNICYKFFAIISFALPQSICQKFYGNFQIILFVTKMPALDRNVKVTCGNCGTSVTKKNLSRHKLGCSGGALYCPKCHMFSTKSRDDLNCHIAKKHSVPRPSITYKCKLCHAEFPGFNALRQHKNTQHGRQIGFGASNMDVEDIVGDADDQSLREELQSCRYFLVDSEIQKGRHSVFNLAVNNFTAQVIKEKFDPVRDKLKCVAKLNLALGFILKNIEDSKFRYFYAHEINTLLEQSKLQNL